MVKLKRIAFGIITGAIALFGMVQVAAARTYDDTWEPPDPSTRADVTINVTSPEYYADHLEFYCGKESFLIYINSGETFTTVTYSVPKGVSKIDFIDPNDIYDLFKITCDAEWLDTDKQNTINVVVDYSDSVKEEVEAEGDVYIEETETPPAVYDFSEGGAYGTISVACEWYGSLDSVIYRMIGDKVYEIALNSENKFRADVYLPAGITYREIGNITVVPCELATVPDTASFGWGHRNNPGYFGNNYEVTEGSHTEINDLYIKMMLFDGRLVELDDYSLLAPKIMSQFDAEAQERLDAFVESHNAAERPTETTTQEETSAPAIAQVIEKAEDEKRSANPFVIGGIVAVIVIGAGVILIKLRKNL